MANQSIISVPPNVEDPTVLRRFLSRLVEQLDVVVGNRAGPNDQYVSQEELLTQAEELTREIENARDILADLVDQIGDLNSEAVIELTQRITAVEQKNNEQDTELNDLDSRVTTLENAGYITDAPSDGNTYGRKDGAWVIIP